MTHLSTRNIQPRTSFPMPRGLRGVRHHSVGHRKHPNFLRSLSTRHSNGSDTTKGIYQQAARCTPTDQVPATSPATIETSNPPAPYTKTYPACVGKHTSIVPYGSHPTGLGWTGQGGSSVADAQGRRLMSLGLPSVGPLPPECVQVCVFSS